MRGELELIRKVAPAGREEGEQGRGGQPVVARAAERGRLDERGPPACSTSPDRMPPSLLDRLAQYRPAAQLLFLVILPCRPHSSTPARAHRKPFLDCTNRR